MSAFVLYQDYTLRRGWLHLYALALLCGSGAPRPIRSRSRDCAQRAAALAKGGQAREVIEQARSLAPQDWQVASSLPAC